MRHEERERDDSSPLLAPEYSYAISLDFLFRPDTPGNLRFPDYPTADSFNFSVKIEGLIWGPPKSSNFGIWGRKWPENRQTCQISNFYYQEMCFHTLSVNITQKTIEIVGIEFWSQRGGRSSNRRPLKTSPPFSLKLHVLLSGRSPIRKKMDSWRESRKYIW